MSHETVRKIEVILRYGSDDKINAARLGQNNH